MDAQLKKGVLEMCILHQCAAKDMYGYEIMKQIKTAFPDVYDGSIYAVLRRLHADGHTETYYGETSSGPKRKYYRITPEGKLYLTRITAEWHAIMLAVQGLGIR
ncbi:PadR family transcriptional regulator [Paenibacillaceae bacterium]|nr:PadR family transcriptional regulator [Paenibacillaceae bacterium]